MSLMTVRGEFEGHVIEVWTSLISGLEIISIDGREVSRKRSFRFATSHELPGELGLEKAVVKTLKIELYREGKMVAEFSSPQRYVVVGMLVLLGVLIGVVSSRSCQALMT